VAETRRDEAQREESRLETRNLDDVAAMMFVRKTG
jgi:flagellar biosynthesis chaperone FliJ